MPRQLTANPTTIGDAYRTRKSVIERGPSLTLIGSSLFEQERTRAGVDGSVQWKSSDDKAELELSGFYSHLNASNYNDNYMFWGSHEFANNLPTSYTVNQGTIHRLANFPNWDKPGVMAAPVDLQ